MIHELHWIALIEGKFFNFLFFQNFPFLELLIIPQTLSFYKKKTKGVSKASPPIFPFYKRSLQGSSIQTLEVPRDFQEVERQFFFADLLSASQILSEKPIYLVLGVSPHKAIYYPIDKNQSGNFIYDLFQDCFQTYGNFWYISLWNWHEATWIWKSDECKFGSLEKYLDEINKISLVFHRKLKQKFSNFNLNFDYQ